MMIVFCNGCFDGLHRGHVKFLERAAGLGELIVGLNSDASVRALKGPLRPLVPQHLRASALYNLGFVSRVIVFEETNPRELIHQLRPDILVRSEEYREWDAAVYDGIRAYGGAVVFLPRTKGYATSRGD